MKIPLAKPYLGEDEARSCYDTILSGWVTQGPKVKEFEEKFASFVGAKFAVAVSSCTTALHLAMIVAGIKEGDEVICPSLSFIASANCITYVGAIPVFADVELNTQNLDVTQVEKSITKKTKAILLVHQLGRPCDIDVFKDLAKKYNLQIIEDAACAIGSKYKGQAIGQHSQLVCFSFHPRKIITTGDGGMITTSNEEFYKKLLLLRQHGMSVNDLERHHATSPVFEKYVLKGYNYRMTDIQASVGIKQLEKVEWIVEQRRRIATQYEDGLRDINCLVLPKENESERLNFQSYSLFLKKNAPLSIEELMQKLLDQGISTRRGVMAIHKELAYQEYDSIYLPNTEEINQRSIIIPLYVPMSKDEVQYVIDNIRLLLHR